MSSARWTKSELYRSRAARRGPYPRGCHFRTLALWLDGEILDHALGFGVKETAKRYGLEPATVEHVLAAKSHIEVALQSVSRVIVNQREV